MLETPLRGLAGGDELEWGMPMGRLPPGASTKFSDLSIELPVLVSYLLIRARGAANT